MNEAYTKLMLQQSTSAEADAAFYEKLEKATSRRINPGWKAAVIAACVCLLVPVTVWAAENIFGVINVQQFERPTYENKPGVALEIQYENIEHYAIEVFPEYLQTLEEGTVLYHDSWEAAEEYLGIDLLSNTLFNDANTRHATPYADSWNTPKNHCQGIYRVVDAQFFSASIQAAYIRNGVTFEVDAMITADHPTVNQEDIRKYYHGTSITYLQHIKPNIQTQQYTTKAGIPALIVTVKSDKWGELTDCEAYFAVNNVSYVVHITGWSFDTYDKDLFADQQEKVMATMMEVLEGFTLE